MNVVYPVPVNAAFAARTMDACRIAAHQPLVDRCILFIRFPFKSTHQLITMKAPPEVFLAEL